MNRRSLLLGVAGAAVIAATGGWIATRSGSTQTSFVTPAFAEGAADGQMLPDIALGKADAPVTVIEYASYTCPHCAHFHDDVLSKLKKDYIDTGKVKFILREVYFDKFGLWAGQIAQCGGDLKYYGISDMLFSQQEAWIADGKEATIAENLRKIGLKAGLSKDQIETCLNDQALQQKMVATFQAHMQEHKIKGTPALVIDGDVHDNMSYDDLKKILDAKLAG